MIAVDPYTVKDQILTWIGALTLVLGPLSGFIALALSYVNKVKAELSHKDLTEKHEDNAMLIQGLQDQVTKVALVAQPKDHPPLL